MAKWLSTAGDWTLSDDLKAALNDAAANILAVALTPEAVALNRLIIAESARFPELPLLLRQAGATEGTARIAAILERAVAAGTLPPLDIVFHSEQFLHLVLAGPQRRALGLGPKLDEQQIEAWGKASVELFLKGIGS